MPYSNEIFNIAKDRMSERRQQALRAAEYKRERLFDEIPRLREINSELLSIGASIAKAVLKGEGEQTSLRELSERSIALQEEQKAILSERGLDESVLEPKFSCPICEDTGFVEADNRTEVCECFGRLMSEIASEQLGDSLPLADCTFDSFDLSYYSDQPDESGRSPLTRMTNIYNYCVDYAGNFSVSSKSLLMRGATGLGKTHLSLAIANEVIKKGVSVIYVSAPKILWKLEREHFAYRTETEEDSFGPLLDCDLLIIDDLGTEFISKFSVSCVYNLFNSRLLAGKPIIISTNLTISELVENYSQRFVSRIIGSCDKLEFIGEDIRTKR